jgi:hypothetical protein
MTEYNDDLLIQNDSSESDNDIGSELEGDNPDDLDAWDIEEDLEE